MKATLAIILTGVIASAYAMNCRVCGPAGLCQDEADNGMSQACDGSCAHANVTYSDGRKVTHRMCWPIKLDNSCVEGTLENHSGKFCYCNDDDCNADNNCTCPSVTTTEKPITTTTPENSNTTTTQKPTTTTPVNSNTTTTQKPTTTTSVNSTQSSNTTTSTTKAPITTSQANYLLLPFQLMTAILILHSICFN